MGDANQLTETTYSAILVTQGDHRFYTLSMFSDVLASCCTVDARAENPLDGFQRKLDGKRADEIAKYIDDGGTIPSSIVLSAQSDADFKYTRQRRSVTFKNTPKSFLILDGQHRVYGFARAKTKLRVPVVIYNNLSRIQECRLFIDINTKQRPVPNELLLDIKRLADTEDNDESFLRDVFDLFAADPGSPLMGLMTPSSKAKGKLSRVTFNAAVKVILDTFEMSEPKRAYETLAAYLHACLSGLRAAKCEDRIVNPTLFKALVALFPDVAQRVADRFPGDYSSQRFGEVLQPFFEKVKTSELKSPGNSHVELHETFRKVLRHQFRISGV